MAPALIAALVLALTADGASARRKVVRGAAPTVQGVADTPHPETPAYNGDWAVGCDNVLQCEATALAPDGAEDDDGVLLQIIRLGGPGGDVTLRARSFDSLPTELSLMADGREIARLTGSGGDEVTLGGGRALVAVQAMASAVTIELRTRTRKPKDATLIAAPSSAGLVETLTYIDARQGRTGTVSALAARGTHSDADVPAAPAVPMVPQMTSPDADTAPGLNATEIAMARKLATCDPSLQAVKVEELVSLDQHAALVLLPCEAGAYNVSAVPLVATGEGAGRKLSVARFDFAPGFTGEPGKPPLVVNALWDARRGILSSLAKGRGAGDCGAAEDYVWDGAMFRLIESRAMHVCRGAWDWIRLWTAVPRRTAVKVAG